MGSEPPRYPADEPSTPSAATPVDGSSAATFPPESTTLPQLAPASGTRPMSGHVVFRPARMTAAQLQQGYEWCYRTLFSFASIWRRRPADLRAVPAYLAMSLLYKKANWLWPFLIRHRLVARFWRPLVELTRWRHLRFRKALATRGPGEGRRAGAVVSAGV